MHKINLCIYLYGHVIHHFVNYCLLLKVESNATIRALITVTTF